MNEAALSKMNPDWLRDQKEKLASGDYFLLHRGKNSYVLKAVVFGRDYSTELLYHDPEHDQSFQICVRRNGVEADLPEPLLLDMALNEMEKYYNDSARHSEAEGAPAMTVQVRNLFRGLCIFGRVGADVSALPAGKRRDILC